jgi:hypothetical protein
MDNKNIVIIVVGILLIFFILRNVNTVPIYTPEVTTTTVVYRKPIASGVNYVNSPPYYNAYKAQYYN